MNRLPRRVLFKKRVRELEEQIANLRRVADAGYALAQTIRRVRKPNTAESCGIFTELLNTENCEREALRYMEWAYQKFVNPGIMRFP